MQDSLSFIADSTQTSLTDSTSWISKTDDVSSIILNFVTAIGIVYGLIVGGRKIEKYLKDEYIKSKFDRINDKNLKTGEVAQSVVNEVRGMYDPDNRVLEEIQFTKLQELARDLENISKGASNRVSTLAYLLSQTLANINFNELTLKNVHKDVRIDRLVKSIPFSSNLFLLLQNSCQRIHADANNIVDIPNTVKEEFLNQLKPEINKYLDTSSDISIKGYSVGVNYNPNSEYSFTFSNILRKSCEIPLLHKSFYQVIGENYPVIHYLNFLGVYSPPKLELIKSESSELDTLFNFKSVLHLINIERKTRSKFDDSPPKKIIRFTYANLNKGFKFVDTSIREESDLTEKYYDCFLDSDDWHQSWVKKFDRLGNEIIRFECDEEKAKKHYKEVENQILNYLDDLSGSTES